jgi:hypothetical protein
MAAGNTYTQIASTTLGSAASSVTFSSIPATYTDLRLVISTQTNTGAYGLAPALQFNGDTATNYSRTYMFGNGSSAASGRTSNTAVADFGDNVGANQWSNCTVDIMNYSNSTTYKTFLYRQGNGYNLYTTAGVILWRSTAAITSILVTGAGPNSYATGSTFNLYGIQSA